MDTSKLKSFAQEARTKLIEQVGNKLKLVLNDNSAARRESPEAIKELEKAIKGSSEGQVTEQVAYTWFNRFCALRYLDVKRYNKILVVSPAEGKTKIEILAEAQAGLIDESLVPKEATRQRIQGLLRETVPSPYPEQEAYQLLLVAACNSWHKAMPFLFETIADYTELLMPDDLLAGNSILASTREAMTPDTCESVEVIGWLYQFYISEKKDSVMARKSAVPTEDIPAVTQLFTPHWIVRYLVENSLGRLWLLNNPSSKLREKMPYYIEEVESGKCEVGSSSPASHSPLPTSHLIISSPEEIRILDPACGSGHMLTYAFDLLYAIYEEQGYEAPSIPGLILKHNLYGIDICPRAAALAAFALVMKAREKSRRFFASDNRVLPNITELVDVKFAEGELHTYFKAIAPDRELTQMWPGLSQLCQQFEEAKNFGSLIQPCLTEAEIQSVLSSLHNSSFILHNSEGQLFLRETHLKVLRVLDLAEALTQRYHVVVANPPYIGGKYMNATLKAFAKTEFPESSSDAFSVFVERVRNLALCSGKMGFVTPYVWMFIPSYQTFREKLLSASTISTLIQLEYNAFEPACVPVCCFVLCNSALPGVKGAFIRLSDFRGHQNQGPKTLEAIGNPNCSWFFRTSTEEFRKIQGCPIAYWVTDKVREIFIENEPLEKIGAPRSGITTGDNGTYLRYWFEIESFNKTLTDINYSPTEDDKWVPLNGGSEYRKWYGSNLQVILWEKKGLAISTDPRSTIANLSFQFKAGITWSKITSSMLSVRMSPPGFIFSAVGLKSFPNSAHLNYVCGFLNSKVVEYFKPIFSSTLSILSGDIAKLPLVMREEKAAVDKLVEKAVADARADWDNFETSWDFRNQPLLRPGLKGATLEASWRNWEAQSTAAIHRMQELETENNRLFIAAYGLDGELQPEVPEAQITLARAEARRDMAAFLSYAVGCMMGRYSLDHPGLILANAGDSLREFLEKVGKPLAELTFTPDEDGIIPVLDGEWFEDDIVARFRAFLRATFGDLHFEQNLAFIESALGNDLRSYFVKDFYKNHVQTYKKRPIYWMFSSAKGGFQALVYLHRYRPDTVSQLLNGYLRQFRTKLALQQERLQAQSINSNLSAREKTAAIKELDKLKKLIAEVEAYERDIIFPLATQNLAIDLDDGVKVNYLKFGEALKTITGLAAKEDE